MKMLFKLSADIYHFGIIWIMNQRAIRIQVLFLIWCDRAQISVTQSQDVWNGGMNGCMRMSSRAPLSPCRPRLAERQARAMMSPSLANKLWLTLWGPWRKGNGMEWECAAVMLRESIHGRWEAAAVLGEAGGDASRRKPFREGEGHTTAAVTAGEEEEGESLFVRQRQPETELPLLSVTREENGRLWVFYVKLLSCAMEIKDVGQ